MWHEARKQERKIRVMMVDYKRRADRRRDYYEKIKQDPNQFIRIHGRRSNIHWESSVALAADGPQSMMPWQGDADIQIDRFDVRAHLDYIPEYKPISPCSTEGGDEEERNCNYERYRILVQNDVAGVSENACLKQIEVDEMYGAIDPIKPEIEEKGKKQKAAIAFNYEDSTPEETPKEKKKEESSDEDVEDEDEVDLDNIVDIFNITLEQEQLLNVAGNAYGMADGDFSVNMDGDRDEAEALRLAKIMEEEKAQFSGRKSRRERRAFKEKRLMSKQQSPPSYAQRNSPSYEPMRGSSSERSRSRSPVGGTVFITSFGADSDEDGGGVLQGPTLPPHLQVQAQQRSQQPASQQSGTVPGTKHSAPRSVSRSFFLLLTNVESWPIFVSP